MTKYRLNIKYPITKEDVRKIVKNTMSIYWLNDHDGTVFDDDEIEINKFPESWIEEVKESEFYNYIDNKSEFLGTPLVIKLIKELEKIIKRIE